MNGLISKKHGIEKIQLMCRLIPALEAKGKNSLENGLNTFKSFIVQQIKRGITREENINLLHGITDYVMSEPGTNERLKSIDYLFELEWLND